MTREHSSKIAIGGALTLILLVLHASHLPLRSIAAVVISQSQFKAYGLRLTT